jgi:undecaprenyl-diphosphatase
MSAIPEESEARVEQVLRSELEQVDSPDVAEAVIERVERLAAGQTEAERAAKAEQAPTSAATAVEQAATAGPAPAAAAAAMLTTAAGRAVADTPEAPAVVEAAQQALGVAGAPTTPEAERGRHYLREAVMRRMGPLQALDARLFLAVNRLPHPHWLNSLLYGVSWIATGGWVWLVGVLVARRLGVRGSRGAVRLLLPSMIGATWIVEHPIKQVCRRRRPFIDIVRALVVGKKPGSWSFPSGHTAASFAAALTLSTIWPRRAPQFFGLATTVGFSRIYLGAHYPGDVASGALLGMLFAELIRRAISRQSSAVRSVETPDG